MSSTGVVLMAYGTPTGPDDLERYYTDIRRGRPPSPEQLAELASRYAAIGGVSPLAERTEAQRRAIAAVLGPDFDVVLGMKHSPPTIADAVDGLARRGVRRVVGLVLAPHYSALSVGEYLARLEEAGKDAGVDVVGIESWAQLPAYVEFLAARVREARAALPRGSVAVFTAHSLPERILATGDPYPDELVATAAAVARAVGLEDGRWTTAWQSAGRTPEPWLGPDIAERMSELAAAGVPGVVVCPCGFVADHLEVLYDLDVAAKDHAGELGIAFARTPAVNDDVAVMAALAACIAEVA